MGARLLINRSNSGLSRQFGGVRLNRLTWLAVPAVACLYWFVINRPGPSVRTEVTATGWLKEAMARFEQYESVGAAEEILIKQLANAAGDTRRLAEVHASIGLLTAYRGDLEAARESWMKAVSLFDELGDTTEGRKVKVWINQTLPPAQHVPL